MIRKAIIVVLTIAASAVFLVWLLGAFGQLTLRYGMPDQNRVLEFGCYDGTTRLGYTFLTDDIADNLSINWGGFEFIRQPIGALAEKPFVMYSVSGPEWSLFVPFAILGTYPTAAFIRGPLRRWRRRRKGLCPRCGYNLEGNVSGACPECGEEVE